ncbi:MAG: glycoside hydrolase family 2 protein [Anaerolineae bacterium]
MTLITRWGETVTADTVHPDYPRPQMVRADWQNLNGVWAYAITPRTQATVPTHFDGEILVPFPLESALSGVSKRITADQLLWYQRTLDLTWSDDERVLLHFGAVDWETTVWVNGVEVGQHRGGYDPFSFDVTDALSVSGQQLIVVKVWDPTDQSYQPRGKQVEDPKSIWYTPITGIWQTVWLERVPRRYIANVTLTPDVDTHTLQVRAEVVGSDDRLTLRAQALDGRTCVADVISDNHTTLTLSIPDPKLWSPATPFLYDLKVVLQHGDDPLDQVDSYFGMRKMAVANDANGALRFTLNDEPIFNYGLLDQGFWPDGLYTPPTDDALRYDIELTKELGFNTIRKHVKVEPARWYYWADKLGVLVWQDMPSGDQLMGRGEGESVRTPESAQQFQQEYQSMVRALFNYPSIVMWVVFNEGWGQFDTVKMTDFAESLDSTRLINSVSGWNDMNVGHMHDIHRYPGPDVPPESPGRALVLGEFGGLGLPVEGHMWVSDFWGYRAFDDQESLTEAYRELIEALRPMIAEQGLAAAIYTQTTDVETEANGMVTYDRAVIKMDVATVRELSESLYGLETPVSKG